jgi:hypothetical protein
LYADETEKFTSKARWWACPVGDPNAGKSPSCSFICSAFQKVMQEHRNLFYPIDHFCRVGNNGKIQERLRSLEGVLILWGPEAKLILDPNSPLKNQWMSANTWTSRVGWNAPTEGNLNGEPGLKRSKPGDRRTNSIHPC